VNFVITPVVCLILGVGGGIGAGIFLAPMHESGVSAHIDDAQEVVSGGGR
jgi:hypothetical protein